MWFINELGKFPKNLGNPFQRCLPELQSRIEKLGQIFLEGCKA
jgi:hypothetical protein